MKLRDLLPRRTWWERLLERWPLVWKKTAQAKRHQLINGQDAERLRLREENAKEREALNQLIRRLTRITVDPVEHMPDTFQLRLCFREELVYRALVQGESHHIDYLIRSMAHELEREMRTMNFARFRDYPRPPRRPASWAEEGPR